MVCTGPREERDSWRDFCCSPDLCPSEGGTTGLKQLRCCPEQTAVNYCSQESWWSVSEELYLPGCLMVADSTNVEVRD